MPGPTTDAAQVRACQAGDSKAFEPLVTRYQNAAYAIALEYLRDPMDAQDAVQDAFVAAYCKLDQLRDPAAFGGWFRRLVTTRCQVWLRQRHIRERRLRILADDASVSDRRVGHNGVLSQEVWRLVDRLPQEMRTTTRLHYLSGFTYAEIAGFLDVPVTTVKGRLQQARLRLREYLASDQFKEMTMQGIDITDDVKTTVRRIATAFEPDVRLFTAMAFINAAGYNHEWDQGGMHPMRKKVREHVAKRLSSAFLDEIRAFYKDHDAGNFYYYGTFALCTSGPPDFALQPVDPDTSDSTAIWVASAHADMSDLLARFYRQADIETIWAVCQPEIHALNRAYRPFAYQAFDEVTTFCRVDPSFAYTLAETFHFTVDPLISLFTSYCVKINNQLYNVDHTSRFEQPGPFPFYGRVLSEIVHPMFDRYRAIIERYAELNAVSRTIKTKVDYSDWHNQAYRSLLRAIDRILTGRALGRDDAFTWNAVLDEYRLALILCPYFYEALSGYEKSDQPLEVYFPTLIEGIDIEHEKTRWRDFWAAEAGRS